MSGVAIVGMACVLPGAPDLGAFWENVVGGVDAISEVPPERWDPVFYDPASSAPDRFYCRRGGFVDEYATFDPLAFGIMPAAAEGAEPDQLLTLEVATRALADAGYDSREFDRERTGIVLGRGNYLGAGITRLIEHVRHGQQVVELLRSLLPDASEEDLQRVKAAFQGGVGAYGPDTAIGLVPNLTASRISNRLDLGGPAYTVDAACASSLVALDHACRDLRDGTVDLALAGGVHLTHDPSFWSIFCQLGALSRREEIRPFDSGADGLLIGEGVALVALKRVEDAERDDDRIYAVVRGTGVASDGRHTSLMTPRVDGQLNALRRAWERARLDPASIGLVEAHGTATPAGDAAELETLARFFGPPNGHRAGLGSVKSMIGHTMPAAGAAGLVKAALAVHHGVLPPTLHCEEPHAGLSETRFRLVTEAEPWEDAVRRAGVNAFGFGGINAHAVVDAHAAPRRRRRPDAAPAAEEEEILVCTAATREGLLAALDGAASEAGPWRVAVVEPTPERLAAARAAVEAGRPRRGRDGIFFAQPGLLDDGGLVAFVFPGVEPAFAPRLDGFDLAAVATEEDLEQRGLAVIQVGRSLHRAVTELGLEPDVIAGHSIGEWNGMIAAGMLAEEDVDPFIASLSPGSLEVPGVVFAALGCGAGRAAAAIADLPGVVVSHDNCVHQSLISGPEDEVAAAVARLRESGVLVEVLRFPHGGYHSPALAPYVGTHRAHYETLRLRPPAVPLWSATTCAPYPSDLEAIRTLAVDHLLQPVRFRELVLALYEHGVRVFVQVGTGSTTRFVADTLGRRPHLAISVNVPQRSGRAQLRRAAAALFVEGAPVRLDAVGLAPRGATRTRMRLQLGVPLVRLETPPLVRAARPPAPAAGPLAAEFDATLRLLDQAQEDVRRAFAATAASPPLELVERLALSVDTHPELVDHCLFPQPPGWPELADRYPVVPMTMSVALFLDAARRAAPGRIPVGLRDLRALRWLAVEPPLEATLRARYDGRETVAATIEGYLEATVDVADSYPPAPPAALTLDAEARPPVSADELYRDGWMFHGPAYQGVVAVAAVSTDGIRGTLRALPAPGALLDAAGQLFGHWMMIQDEDDRLLMPLRLERLELFAPDPEPGGLVECTVRVTRLGAREVRADLELVHGGRVHARVTGWEDVRFRTDERVWSVMMDPGRGLLASPDRDGFVLFDRAQARFPSTDYLARRYLSKRERDELEALPAKRRAEWLGGRVAIKDAVRDLLLRRGHGPLYPVEVAVSNDPAGRPVVSGPFADDVRVSVAHKGDRSVALARIGADAGIDLERVEPRGEGFVRLAFRDEELAILPAGDRAEWLTRLWCAKEAVGKARGTGLAGAPRELVATNVDGDLVVVAGTSVRTRCADGYVIAWTEGEQSA